MPLFCSASTTREQQVVLAVGAETGHTNMSIAQALQYGTATLNTQSTASRFLCNNST
jgi:16S rRNA U1498 N3-methylase RsmE